MVVSGCSGVRYRVAQQSPWGAHPGHLQETMWQHVLGHRTLWGGGGHQVSGLRQKQMALERPSVSLSTCFLPCSCSFSSPAAQHPRFHTLSSRGRARLCWFQSQIPLGKPPLSQHLSGVQTGILNLHGLCWASGEADTWPLLCRAGTWSRARGSGAGWATGLPEVAPVMQIKCTWLSWVCDPRKPPRGWEGRGEGGCTPGVL